MIDQKRGLEDQNRSTYSLRDEKVGALFGFLQDGARKDVIGCRCDEISNSAQNLALHLRTQDLLDNHWATEQTLAILSDRIL